MNLETQFDVKQTVWIKPLGCCGVVLSIYLGDQGLQYNVRYFHNGDAKTVYFYEDELRKPEPHPLVGGPGGEIHFGKTDPAHGGY